MSQESDVSTRAGESRVIPVVHGFRRTRLVDVGLNDYMTVQDDGDLSPVSDHLLGIPLTDRCLPSAFRGYYPIDRAMVLVGLQSGVLFR